VAAAWPEPVERVSSFLREAGAEARIEQFAEGTPTASDAAAAVGCGLDQIVKSLVFVCDERPVVALVPGDLRGDREKVALEARAEKARIASAEEVEQKGPEATLSPAVEALELPFEPCLFLIAADGTLQRRLDVIFDEVELANGLAQLTA